jgi:hypothetical protein
MGFAMLSPSYAGVAQEGVVAPGDDAAADDEDITGAMLL